MSSIYRLKVKIEMTRREIISDIREGRKVPLVNYINPVYWSSVYKGYSQRKKSLSPQEDNEKHVSKYGTFNHKIAREYRSSR